MPDTPDQNLRVCIVAEHASYKFGGEAVLPLHYFAGLRARGIETWLVVHARTRDELAAAFPDGSSRIRFIEDAWFHKLLFRLSPLLPRRIAEATLGLLSQLITQLLARRIVRELVREGLVNIVHQPIPVSPRFPSLMARVGAPVIIGPMNGGMEYPPAFRRSESMLTRFLVWIGRRASNSVNAILPGKKYARVLLVANQRTKKALPSCARGEVILLPENAVNIGLWDSRDSIKVESGLDGLPRFTFIGRLVDWKRVDIAIEALSRVPGALLEIIGDGPMWDPWQDLARKVGVESRVIFSGWLSQKMFASSLQSARALVLPSIYESGGAVALEAMAAATPVIATNWGGPTDYLNNSCGILVEPSGHEQMVAGFARAMTDLIENPQWAHTLGANGRKRAMERFDWQKKVDMMIQIYENSLSPNYHEPAKSVTT